MAEAVEPGSAAAVDTATATVCEVRLHNSSAVYDLSRREQLAAEMLVVLPCQ